MNGTMPNPWSRNGVKESAMVPSVPRSRPRPPSQRAKPCASRVYTSQLSTSQIGQSSRFSAPRAGSGAPKSAGRTASRHPRCAGRLPALRDRAESADHHGCCWSAVRTTSRMSSTRGHAAPGQHLADQRQRGGDEADEDEQEQPLDKGSSSSRNSSNASLSRKSARNTRASERVRWPIRGFPSVWRTAHSGRDAADARARSIAQMKPPG